MTDPMRTDYPTSGHGKTAKDVSSIASDTARKVQDDATTLAGQARDRAESELEAGKDAGARKANDITRAMKVAADELNESSPLMAKYVHEAAESVGTVANALRERSPRELMGELSGFARRQPVAFFGAAVLAGVVIARFARSSASANGYGSSDRDMYRAGGPRGSGTWQPDTGHAHAPGWTPGSDGTGARPATMAGATLGGAAAHRPQDGSSASGTTSKGLGT